MWVPPHAQLYRKETIDKKIKKEKDTLERKMEGVRSEILQGISTLPQEVVQELLNNEDAYRQLRDKLVQDLSKHFTPRQ